MGTDDFTVDPGNEPSPAAGFTAPPPEPPKPPEMWDESHLPPPEIPEPTHPDDAPEGDPMEELNRRIQEGSEEAAP